MNSASISAIIIAILFGGPLIAMLVARFLPDHHLSPETRSVVSVSVAVIGTLSALVLGLLISTANSSFIAKAQEVADISANVISPDRLMQRLGPEAQDGRVLLRRYTAAELQDLFPADSHQPPNVENIATVSTLEELQNKSSPSRLLTTHNAGCRRSRCNSRPRLWQRTGNWRRGSQVPQGLSCCSCCSGS
jgi:hypothetical protein